jgi:hypothetical protein
MSLDSIVKVNITRDTKVPTQKGFGVPAILSTEANLLLTNLVTEYESDSVLESLIAAGFTTASQTYLAASAMVSQSPKIEKLKVIKQTPSVAQTDIINIDSVENAATYAVTFNGVLVEYLSDADATDAEIQAGLIALLAGIAGVNAGFVANGTDKIDVTATNAGEGYSVSVGDAKLSITAGVANNGPVEDLIAARDEDDDWYFLTDTTHTPLQVTLISAYIETIIKLYAYQTSDANSKDEPGTSATPGLIGDLKAQNYDRSFGVWVPAAELVDYKMAAWVGLMAPKDPGSATWKFKEGNAISANKFTSQEKKNIQDKNGNVYINVAGFNIFEEGVVASGEFIDIMRGTDWIQARIQEQVFGLLVSSDKVPYTDGGIESIGLQVEEVLDRAVDRLILVGGEDGPVVTVPKRSETTKADRAARFLRDVKFTGNYAGAIHKVQIDGTLSV